MTEQKTHWRKVDNPNYIGAYSMPSDGSDVVLTIKEVKIEEIKGEGGNKKTTRVAYFHENSKPMIINATNSKVITALYKSGHIEDWSGKKIQIFVDWIKDRGTGLQIQCLRLRPFIPKTEKQPLLYGTPQYDEAVKYIAGGGAVEKVESKYLLTKEVKDELCKHLAKKD